MPPTEEIMIAMMIEIKNRSRTGTFCRTFAPGYQIPLGLRGGNCFKSSVRPTAGYRLVQLPNGTHSVYAPAYDEKMHPGPGPAAEAELLYVRQLKIPERMREGQGEFTVWDVGLGAAANVLAVLRSTREIPRPLRLVSFDNTAGPLAFALQHAPELGYLKDYERAAAAILERGQIQFTDGARQVDWRFQLGDFPSLLAHPPAHPLPPPSAILFDAFSPAKNPAMWTLPLFTNLFRVLDPQRPCALTTYSRSTMFRVTLLLAGFFVGRGHASGMKEETTVAANRLELLDEPLDQDWLARVQRSGSAEPLSEPIYRQAKVSAATWARLRGHAQFREGGAPGEPQS